MSTFLLDEIKREKDFYESKGLPYPKDLPNPNEQTELKTVPHSDSTSQADFHRYDEQVLFSVNITCSAVSCGSYQESKDLTEMFLFRLTSA